MAICFVEQKELDSSHLHLKPCPFCSTPPHYTKSWPPKYPKAELKKLPREEQEAILAEENDPNYVTYQIECLHPRCAVRPHISTKSEIGYTPEKIAEIWNTRNPGRLKRDNFTLDEIIHIVKGHRLMDPTKDQNPKLKSIVKDHNAAIGELLDTLEALRCDPKEYHALAYQTTDNTVVHIGPILPQ